VLIVGLTWVGTRFIPTSSQARAPALAPPALLRRATPVQATRPQLPVYDLAAIQDLERFTPRFNALEAQFSVAFESLQLGTLSQADFSEDLQRLLIPQWRGLSDELGTPRGEMTTPRIKADDQLYQVIECWIRALNLYVQGLHDRDYREVLHSFDLMRDADNYEQQAYSFLHQMQASR
jgi:hypothetical protein